MVRRFALVLIGVALVVAGCGGGDDGGGKLTVSAASSLKTAFTKYQPDAGYSFAGSDQLAAQIKGGARRDVFASANTTLPDELYKAGLVEKPVVFAGNRLVLAVPASAGKVKSLADLEKPRVAIAARAETGPAGRYTRG